MLVLVTLFICGLHHFISLFHFCCSTWLHYDELALTKMVKRPTILNNEKLGFLIYVSKKMFCSSNESKMEYPPEEVTMNIDEDFRQFKKENRNEQQNSEENKKVALTRFDKQIGKKEFTAFLRIHAKGNHFGGEKYKIFKKFCMKHPQLKHFYNSITCRVNNIKKRSSFGILLKKLLTRKASISYCLIHCS